MNRNECDDYKMWKKMEQIKWPKENWENSRKHEGTEMFNWNDTLITDL